MTARLLLPLLLAVPLAAQGPEAGRAGAALEVEAFRYSREIVQVEPGLVALTLDVAALAHSSLDDLRIADARGHQIPYLREPVSDPLIVDLPAPGLVEDDSDPRGSRRASRHALDLPYATLPVSRLLVDTPADVFERTVHLEGGRSRRRDPEWRTPAVVWRDPAPGTPAPPLEVEVPSHPGETVYLVVDEGDNPPLPLTDFRLHLDTWTLRFFHPGGEGVRLLYSHPGLGPPRYDLTLIASQLDPAAREVTLAPEPASEVRDPAGVPRWLFWGALIAAVAVLLLVLARLVREEGMGARDA